MSTDSVHHGSMIRGSGGGKLGGIGPGDKVFCSIQFLVSIDHGGKHRRMTAVGPYSWMISIKQ